MLRWGSGLFPCEHGNDESRNHRRQLSANSRADHDSLPSLKTQRGPGMNFKMIWGLLRQTFDKWATKGTAGNEGERRGERRGNRTKGTERRGQPESTHTESQPIVQTAPSPSPSKPAFTGFRRSDAASPEPSEVLRRAIGKR